MVQTLSQVHQGNTPLSRELWTRMGRGWLVRMLTLVDISAKQHPGTNLRTVKTLQSVLRI